MIINSKRWFRYACCSLTDVVSVSRMVESVSSLPLSSATDYTTGCHVLFLRIANFSCWVLQFWPWTLRRWSGTVTWDSLIPAFHQAELNKTTHLLPHLLAQATLLWEGPEMELPQWPWRHPWPWPCYGGSLLSACWVQVQSVLFVRCQMPSQHQLICTSRIGIVKLILHSTNLWTAQTFWSMSTFPEIESVHNWITSEATSQQKMRLFDCRAQWVDRAPGRWAICHRLHLCFLHTFTFMAFCQEQPGDCVSRQRTAFLAIYIIYQMIWYIYI